MIFSECFFCIKIMKHTLMTIKLTKKHLKIQKTQHLSKAHINAALTSIQ